MRDSSLRMAKLFGAMPGKFQLWAGVDPHEFADHQKFHEAARVCRGSGFGLRHAFLRLVFSAENRWSAYCCWDIPPIADIFFYSFRDSLVERRLSEVESI